MKNQVISCLLFVVVSIPVAAASDQSSDRFLAALSKQCENCVLVGRDIMAIQQRQCSVSPSVAGYKTLLASHLFFLGYTSYESEPGAYDRFLSSAAQQPVCDDLNAWAKEAAKVFGQ